jgi:CheY-like chemotaxis protein
MKNIMILEDSSAMFELYQCCLEGKYHLFHAKSGAKFKQFDQKHIIDLIIMDHTLYGTIETFDELLTYAKKTYPNAKRVLISANVLEMGLNLLYAKDFDHVYSKMEIDFLTFNEEISEIMLKKEAQR